MVAIALGTVWLVFMRPLIALGQQKENVANFTTYGKLLAEYKESHGVFPKRLGDAVYLDWFNGRDSWGNNIVFISNGDTFVIVSCGRDGKPDGTNYFALEVPRFPDDELCSNANIDQILTDAGWYRACAK